MDHAATTQISLKAFEAMKLYLLDEYKNASTLYSTSKNIKKALVDARQDIAECIGAYPEEIYFTSGGSESDNMILKGWTFNKWNNRKIIYTSEIEHHAILNTCKFLENMNCHVKYLSVDNSGLVNTDIISDTADGVEILTSVMMANNEIGTIQDVKNIAEKTHFKGGIFHTDAVQAIGHIPINVNKLSIDSLSASAHKFNGPKGIGFLFLRKGIDIYPLVHGGSQEHGMRAGTENISSIVGMAEALKENVANINKNKVYLNTLSDQLLIKLRNLGIDFIVNGNENRIPGNLSISFAGINGEGLLHWLDLHGIEVATGSACNSSENVVSHVLKAINVPKVYINGTIRISMGIDNSSDEINKLVSSIEKYFQKIHAI